MNKSIPIYICVAALLSWLVAGCHSRREVTIEGVVANAHGECLVLEHLGSGKPETVDTLRLDATGRFRFRPAVEDGPDFFCLRMGQQTISLVVDTLREPLFIKADLKNFGADYTVTQSEVNQRIREASSLANQLRRDVLNLGAQYERREISSGDYRDSVFALIRAYKRTVLNRYIYSNPADPVSYFVLFQSVNGMYIFDPYDAEDNRAYGAVATGWKYNYPASPRCRHLERLALEGQAIRKRERLRLATDSATQSKIEIREYFDIELPDNKDARQSLSASVERNRVTLLDFTSYSIQASVGHNMLLASLHEKYRDRGFGIYQVCLDMDENFWKTSADNIPWVAVRDKDISIDERGMYSRPAAIYNVTKLPTAYLLGPHGVIIGKIEDDKDLEATLREAL